MSDIAKLECLILTGVVNGGVSDTSSPHCASGGFLHPLRDTGKGISPRVTAAQLGRTGNTDEARHNVPTI